MNQAHAKKTRTRGLGRTRRLAWLGAAALPAAVVVWVGCGNDDKNDSAGLLEADPGGTYGAEVVVTIKGRGRVSASMPGLDCPGSCFARYVFDDKAKAGTNAAVVLKAEATPGSSFVGFTFETVTLGARGRGADTCNPLSRATSQPPAANGAEVVLPFGETQGTPPEGAQCSGPQNVPLAYAITATFDTPVVIEAGPPDSGVDAGPPPGELVFDPPTAGAVGKEIGYTGGYLYWRYEVSGQGGIAYGSPSSFPQTPTSLLSTANLVTKFDVSSHVVYQRSGGALYVINGGSTSSTTLTGAPAACSELDSDGSYAYCMTAAGSLYQWTTGGSGPVILHSGVPAGTDKLGVHPSSSYIYFVDDPSGTAGSATIKYAGKTQTVDAGTPTLTNFATALTNPIGLDVNSSYAAWITYDAVNDVGTMQRLFYSSAGSTPTTIIPATNGLRMLAVDPSSSSTFYGAVPATGSIYRSGTTTPIVTGITGLGGIAVDSSYVYWTTSDGRVYREFK